MRVRRVPHPRTSEGGGRMNLCSCEIPISHVPLAGNAFPRIAGCCKTRGEAVKRKATRLHLQRSAPSAQRYGANAGGVPSSPRGRGVLVQPPQPQACHARRRNDRRRHPPGHAREHQRTVQHDGPLRPRREPHHPNQLGRHRRETPHRDRSLASPRKGKGTRHRRNPKPPRHAGESAIARLSVPCSGPHLPSPLTKGGLRGVFPGACNPFDPLPPLRTWRCLAASDEQVRRLPP